MSTVQITCSTPETSIYYTTDGSEPSSSSNLYSSPISVGDLSTVRAVAIKEGWENSDINTKHTIASVAEEVQRVDKIGTILCDAVISKKLADENDSINVYLNGESLGSSSVPQVIVQNSNNEEIFNSGEPVWDSVWIPPSSYDFLMPAMPVKVRTLWYDVSCLSIDTLITLSDNSVKLFRDLLPTDKVKVWNFDEGKYDEASLLWLSPAKPVVGYHLITTSTGRAIKQVNNHRFFDLDENKFERIRSMVGHKVWTADGSEYITEVKLIEEPIEYRNAISFYHMNLITNDFLTSCGFNNIYPIKDMKFIKEERTPRPFEEFNISREFYEGMRMSEQYSPVEEINPYVNRLEEENLVSFT